MFHRVLQVVPVESYKVFIYFSDGKIKLYDASNLVERGIFQKIKDKEVFVNSCTVLNDTLAWDISGKHDPADCLDLDPEVLYENCPEVEEANIHITG